VTLMEAPSPLQRQTRYLALAAAYRERARRASNPELAEGFAKLADGYEGLAETFALLARAGRRQP
jgi:hypothetical protein